MTEMSDKDVAKMKNVNKQIENSVATIAIENIAIDKIKPYALNSKIHSAKHVEALKKNIIAHGLQESLLVEEDFTIVTGHGRLEALKALGWNEIPVRVMRGFTSVECKLHRIASNRTVSNEYDSTLQARELEDIQNSLFKDSNEYSLDELSDSTGLSIRDMEILNTDITQMADLESLILDDFDSPKKDETEKGEDLQNVKLAEQVNLVDLLGFSKVEKSNMKKIREFLAITDIESEASFISFCDQYIDASKDV